MYHILNPMEAEYPHLSLPPSVQEELVGIRRCQALSSNIHSSSLKDYFISFDLTAVVTSENVTVSLSNT
jgi:hypothetical protein